MQFHFLVTNPRIQNINSKTCMHTYIHYSTKNNCQYMETTQMSNDRTNEILVYLY